MKYKDIVYHITEELMAPDKMGVIADDLMDWTICCKRYIDHIPAVEKAVEICF
mgnify:CR=1 FL=1